MYSYDFFLNVIHMHRFYLLHQVHNALKSAFFVFFPGFLPLKLTTNLFHDFGLLLVALVVLRTKG